MAGVGPQTVPFAQHLSSPRQGRRGSPCPWMWGIYAHWHPCPALVQSLPWPAMCVRLTSWEILEPGTPPSFARNRNNWRCRLPEWSRLSWVSGSARWWGDSEGPMRHYGVIFSFNGSLQAAGRNPSRYTLGVSWVPGSCWG